MKTFEELVEPSVSLRGRTSWLVGGPADLFCEPASLDELRLVYCTATEKKLPLTVLAGGTNVLVSDDGIEGIVISLRGLGEISSETVRGRAGREELRVCAQAGVAKSELLKIFLREKLAPGLFLAGLPGQVGGGVVMNAGISETLVPREFNEITDSITVLKPYGELKTYASGDLQWGYRRCEGWKPGIIVEVRLSWPLDPEPDIPDRVRFLNRERLRKQPLDLPSCGSVFRNPEGDSAGRLIEQAGLKGLRVGGAEISSKHANFIVNLGDARASDVAALIERARSGVKEKCGVELESEVVMLGRGFKGAP